MQRRRKDPSILPGALVTSNPHAAVRGFLNQMPSCPRPGPPVFSATVNPDQRIPFQNPILFTIVLADSGTGPMSSDLYLLDSLRGLIDYTVGHGMTEASSTLYGLLEEIARHVSAEEGPTLVANLPGRPDGVPPPHLTTTPWFSHRNLTR